MGAKLKSLGEMDIKDAGVEIQVNDGRGKQIGDLYVTKSGLIWCQGRTYRDNGIKVSWEEFIEWMEGEGE